MQKSEDVATHLKDVKIILGSMDPCGIKVKRIFDDEVCSFADEVSKAIRSDSNAKKYADLMHFAFWARGASISALRRKYSGTEECRLGRGLCFHIAPSNVPVTFAFSFLFSLLAGNSNVVRLPSADFPQTELLINIFSKIFEKYPNISNSNILCSYDRNNKEASEYFSSIADCRMIWGGDSTVNALRSLETKPRCVDLCFADRYSFAVLDSKVIENANDQTLKQLAEKFTADAYTMGQHACSSPHLVIWLSKSKQGRARFWNAVKKSCTDKIDLSGSGAFDKYSALCGLAPSLDVSDFINNKNDLYALLLNELPENVDNLRCGYGSFFEYQTDLLKDVLKLAGSKFQTMTYFGVSADVLQDAVITSGCLGIDRIVPVGSALDMNPIWDGYDVIKSLSRVIDIR